MVVNPNRCLSWRPYLLRGPTEEIKEMYEKLAPYLEKTYGPKETISEKGSTKEGFHYKNEGRNGVVTLSLSRPGFTLKDEKGNTKARPQRGKSDLELFIVHEAPAPFRAILSEPEVRGVIDGAKLIGINLEKYLVTGKAA